jgi:hypothetical protein
MNKKPRSTSTLFVGLLLIFSFSGLVAAEPHPYTSERLNAFKEISSDLCQHQESPKLGQLKIGEDTINFPWALRYIPSISPTGLITITRMPPAKDDTIMDGSNSIAEVEELSAINSVELRNLHYNDSQNGNPEYQGRFNTLGLSVSGKRDSTGNSRTMKISKNNYIEQLADKASRLGVPQRNESRDLKFSSENREVCGNYLGIDVSGITVSAINTMERGSAVATSNIIINPVQIIDLAPEVEEKLK